MAILSTTVSDFSDTNMGDAFMGECNISEKNLAKGIEELEIFSTSSIHRFAAPQFMKIRTVVLWMHITLYFQWNDWNIDKVIICSKYVQNVSPST